MSESRPLSDLFSAFGRRHPAASHVAAAAPATAEEPDRPTKALQKFLAALKARDNPVLVDLGPVVGTNVSYFGELLGCRIRVEDIASDIDAHIKRGAAGELPAFFAKRFTQAPESVDGVLCWDLLDYLDPKAAQTLATALTTMLRPGGVLLGLFGTLPSRDLIYTKYVVVNETTLRYRTYPAARPRQRSLMNGDIIRLFRGLRVSDSFQLKSNVREMLFKKPTDSSTSA